MTDTGQSTGPHIIRVSGCLPLLVMEWVSLSSPILREPGSAYVVERSAVPLIEQGLLRRVDDAPVFVRSAYVIYPANPSQPDIHAIALLGLREVAENFRE